MNDQSADRANIGLAKIKDRNQREHFIPIRQADLVSNLCRSLPDNQRQRFVDLSQLLAATFHYEFHRRMEKLKETYVLLDPDRDTYIVSATDATPTDASLDLRSQTKQAAGNFFDETIELLERANFCRLDRAHIEEAIETASDWGVNLEVNFELFERLEVFARGDVICTRKRRSWRNLCAKSQSKCPCISD